MKTSRAGMKKRSARWRGAVIGAAVAGIGLAASGCASIDQSLIISPAGSADVTLDGAFVDVTIGNEGPGSVIVSTRDGQLNIREIDRLPGWTGPGAVLDASKQSGESGWQLIPGDYMRATPGERTVIRITNAGPSARDASAT